MSDAEQEWKPSGRARPQSTMAQAFSSALDNAFMLDSEVDHLSNSIDQKKYEMMIKNRELEALQARIREAESRLKNRQSVSIEPGTNPAQMQQKGEEAQQPAAGQEESNNSKEQEEEQQQQQEEEEQEQNKNDS